MHLFPLKAQLHPTWASWCKRCHNDHSKELRKKDYVKVLTGERKSKLRGRARFMEIIAPYKAMPCADCGNRFPPCCMDFDHVRGKKEFSIGSVIFGRHVSERRLLEEIEKCEIVCANCHRIRSQRQMIERGAKQRKQAESTKENLAQEIGTGSNT